VKTAPVYVENTCRPVQTLLPDTLLVIIGSPSRGWYIN